eukprot:1229522-Amphidinium_carterae.2
MRLDAKPGLGHNGVQPVRMGSDSLVRVHLAMFAGSFLRSSGSKTTIIVNLPLYQHTTWQ